MAIPFARVSIVHGDQSVVGVAAYIARGNLTSDRLSKRHQYRRRRDDLVSAELFLPTGSPAELRDLQRFWNTVEARESVRDRKTKEMRLRKNAQLAKHIILALPHELDDGERDALVRSFVHEHLVRHGIGVLAAIHRPDDPLGLNWHAHLLATTRVIGPKGFGKKARELNPVFSRKKDNKWSTLHCDDLPGAWRTFQIDWFRRRGLPYNVAPPSDSPDRHHGRFGRANPDAIETESIERAIRAKRRLGDIEQVLASVTRHQSTFTEDDLLGLLRGRGYDPAEAAQLASQALDLPGTKRLYEPGTLKPTPRYTWHATWAEERRILDLARSLHQRQQDKKARAAAIDRMAEAAKCLGLSLQDAAQEAATHAIGGPRLTLLLGEPGDVRTNAMHVIRSDFEKRRFRVIALSSSRPNAAELAKLGFQLARSWKAELAYQTADKPDRPSWNKKTCVIIDNANLIDSGSMVRLLDLAETTGARLVLVGDTTKPSGGRDGMFRILWKELGYGVPRDFRHLKADWAQAADHDLGMGRIGEAIGAYADHGWLHWHDSDQLTRDALVSAWAQDLQNGRIDDRFIFVGTQDNADAVNTACQAARWHGRQPKIALIPTAYGELRLCQLDRIQFFADYPDQGIKAGMRATANGLDKHTHTLKIQTEDGRDLAIDYRQIRNWGLGYAGTAVIAPVKKAYALYDDPDTWTADHLHSALSRCIDDIELHINRSQAKDKEALVQQFSVVDPMAPAHAWLVREDVEAIRAETARYSMTFHLRGKGRTLDLRQPAHRITARRAFALLPMSDACMLYNRVKEIDDRARHKRTAIDQEIHSLKLQLDLAANDGGFRPSTGEAAPWCVRQKTQELKLPLADDFRLEPADGQIDIRGLLHDPLHVPAKDRHRAYDYLYRFRPPVLQAICSSLTSAMGSFKEGKGLWYLLHYANVTVKRILAIAPRSAEGTRRTSADKIAALQQVASEDSCARVTAEFDYRARISDDDIADTVEDLMPPTTSAPPERPPETQVERQRRLEREQIRLERELPRASALRKINLLLDLEEIRLELAPIYRAEDAKIIAAARTKPAATNATASTPPQPAPPRETKTQRLAQRKQDLERREKQLAVTAGPERVELIADIQGLRMVVDLLSCEIEAEKRIMPAIKARAESVVTKAPDPAPMPTLIMADPPGRQQKAAPDREAVTDSQTRRGGRDEF